MASDNDPTDRVLAHRFHRDCGLTLVERDSAGAVCRFAVNEYTANPFGALHGGILYAMMDVAAFLAVLPTLAAAENAVSHDVHVSVLRPVSGDEVTLHARILKRGRGTIFIRVEARDAEDRLAATGTVTKTVVQTA